MIRFKSCQVERSWESKDDIFPLAAAAYIGQNTVYLKGA